MNRKHACHLLMNRALQEPQEVEFDSPKVARAWRYTCYHIRQSLQAGGDTQFNNLVIKVNAAKLTMEIKECK